MIPDINGYKTRPDWFLGKGSFGSVYKAEKEGKLYAIKIFQSELLKTEYRSRLDREIKALEKIDHPNVVKIHDFGTFKEKEFEYFYIVMDFVEGQSLANYIGTVDEAKCIELISSVLDTLDEIHKQGVIHRDLKPANIMVNREGLPIILDFGLAKLIDYSSITQTGERVGTFHYMSPEQITDSKNIDNRSDYFSIGVITYELLTGVLPYDATNLPALIEQIKNQYPKNPSELNPKMSNQTENVILKLLEKEPYKRYQTADEVKNAFASKPKKMPGKIDLSTKHFIRLLHNEKTVFEDALKDNLIPAVIFPANFFEYFHNTVDVLRKSKIKFVADPATNRLTYSSFSKTDGVQKLPYSSGDEVKPIQRKDFNSIFQVQQYVKKVIDFQIANGVTELAAPFFFAKDSTDEWFNINLKLLKEAISYRDEHHAKLPIWAGICMNVENWHDDDEKDRILNNYVKANPDGFFVYGDPIGNQSNLTQLFHYADLLKKLQDFSGTPVVACRVGGLGLILLCFGIAGINSGIAGLDNFRESILSDIQDGYAQDPRYYIPELMSMVSLKKGVTTKLSDIARSSIGDKLHCSCKYCKGSDSGSLTPRNIKLHFLLRRADEIQKISALKPQDKILFIEDRLNQALGYEKLLKDEKINVGDFSHLKMWDSLVERFKKR